MREMKDSGVQWIGPMPAEWVLKKIKNAASYIGSGTTPTSSKIENYENGTINWIQSGDLYGRSVINSVNTKVTFFAIRTSSSLRVYKSPFIVVAMYGGSVGNIAISTIDACVNQACCCIQPDKNNSLKFLYYWIFACKPDFLRVTEGGGQPNISQNKIKNQYYAQPSIEEQNSIVKFLDSKCSIIDALSATIQSEIDKLEEYKRSVITEAVTKGLDKNAEMKESGSQYWGQIPKNWDLADIKYLFQIVKRIAGHEGYDVLSITQRGIKVKDISTNEGQIAADYSHYQVLYPGEYAMNHMDLLTGWVDLSDKFGVTSPDYRVFRLRDTMQNDRHYYKYIMQLCYMCRIFYSLGQGVSNLGRWRLQTSSFLNFQVPVPPKNEQKAIADYLDLKTAQIEAVIDLKNKQLDTLNRYKKSLIYEYVTGKKEVPSV